MWRGNRESTRMCLDGDERHLNIRAFSDNMKREAYERQKGICVEVQEEV